MWHEHYPITRLRPASYNPREISDKAIERLRASITTCGMLKPIIATSGGTIIAGHQRTKAMTALGMETCPAHILGKVSLQDEIRFNQLHNASDLELTDGEIRVPAGLALGWQTVGHKDIHTNRRDSKVAAMQNEICRLLNSHGAWGGSVADDTGRVIVSTLYADCCRILRLPLQVCIVPHALVATVCEFFGLKYGEFSYGHIERTTWAQSAAQMNRLEGTKQLKSTCYEKAVMPLLAKHPHWSILDFGSGKGAYAKRLQRQGRDCFDIEFYRLLRGSKQVDVAGVQRRIGLLCTRLRKRGRVDLVVCDSVLNSTDRQQAQTDVMRTINAFCKPGGTVVFSGRATEHDLRIKFSKLGNGKARHIFFTDEEGYTAMFRSGNWEYQRFHTKAQALALARKFVGDNPAYKRSSTSWQIVCRKTRELPVVDVEASLAREFDLLLPKGSYNRSGDMVAAWRKVLAIERGEERIAPPDS
ncbi:MAG: ParB N-terminal domain-containing protein [Phycisphaerales bacterium]|nr:ParB N-terminal domain-containing protein [Phycisphaerales bacterium]